MIENNAEIPNIIRQELKNENLKISRRDFLKLLTSLGSALVLDKCNFSIPSAHQSPLSSEEATPPPDLRERFRELGMSDFYDFYKIVFHIEQKYQSRGNGHFFSSIYNLCRQVADGTIEPQNSELVRVRDGWGKQEKNVKEAALTHIGNISVIPVQDAKDDPEELKNNQLKLFAESFGPMALALPNKIYIFYFGAGQTTKDYIAIKSFSQFKPWVAWLEFFHEATHSTDIYFERIKPFVQRKQYLEYITQYYKDADKILSAAFATENPDQHRDFWKHTQFGALLALPDVSQRMKPVFTRLESIFYGRSLDTKGNFFRYTRLVWEVGRRLQTIWQKQRLNQALTSTEKHLLNNNDVSTLMTMALQETLHVLVDSREEFYPQIEEAEHPTRVITDAQKELNDLRIRTFATFPLEEGKSPMVQMKERLGF